MCDSHDFELVSRPTFELCLDSLSAVRNGQLLHALLYAQLRGNAIGQSAQQKLETEGTDATRDPVAKYGPWSA